MLHVYRGEKFTKHIDTKQYRTRDELLCSVIPELLRYSPVFIPLQLFPQHTKDCTR